MDSYWASVDPHFMNFRSALIKVQLLSSSRLASPTFHPLDSNNSLDRLIRPSIIRGASKWAALLKEL